ncbi:MAG TPA: hypothetical protein VGN00_25020 [Puia sp.]|jgi:hypothetical protein
MQKILTLGVFVLAGWMLTGCSGLTAKSNGAVRPSSHDTSPSAGLLIDTAKLQGDLNSVISSMAGGKPDTTAMKTAATDFLSTSDKVLSDSGIDALYGSSNDPSVKAAAAALKKWRNGMGFTPAKLDSLKKATQALREN